MTRRRIIASLMGLFFVALITAFVWVNVQRPRILVLHSYNTDYAWTRDLNVGLKREMDQQSWIRLSYNYMNTKNRSDEDHLRRAGIAARKAIDEIKPDVVIAFDDYAQKLAGSYYVNHPHVKIVFAGVNGSVEPYGYDKAKNVTGIFERKPVGALKEVMLLLGPAIGKNPAQGQTIRALNIADTTLSANKDSAYLRSYDWSPLVFVGSRFMGDFEQWKRNVLGARDEVDFLLVGGYRKLKRQPDSLPKDGFVPPYEVMRWTEANSPVPVIGINVFNTEDGAMLSVGVSPYEQGKTAARMARQIIERHVSPSDIERVTSQQYVVSFRKSALIRRRLKMPHIFEAFARATDNYFD